MNLPKFVSHVAMLGEYSELLPVELCLFKVVGSIFFIFKFINLD